MHTFKSLSAFVVLAACTVGCKGRGETVTDIDGNAYNTVRIGDQVWMTENLRTTRYNDGTPIPLVSDSSVWSQLNTAAYSWYGNDSNNRKQYGALYNWHAVNSGKLAPRGWHVPTDAEWSKLVQYLVASGYNWDETKQGNKIAKSLASKTGWELSDSKPGAIGNVLSKNNRSGFSAVPSGTRSREGRFAKMGEMGFWWTATDGSSLRCSSCAWVSKLEQGWAALEFVDGLKTGGNSVRLLRDSPSESPSGEELVLKVEAMFVNDAYIYVFRSKNYESPNTRKNAEGRIGSFERGSVVEVGPGEQVYLMGVKFAGLPEMEGRKGVIKWDPSDSKDTKLLIWNVTTEQ
jgi:uncharacterized protein (TIGR02145 family)